ncbi:hypothetical protein Bca4012_077836 [Brassica carinata]
MGEIQKQELKKLGDLCTHLSKSTDQSTHLTFPLIGGGVSELPRCFKELAGKQCLFQIRVTPYNFTPHYRTFTVDEYVDVKTHSGGESNNRAPQVVSQSEQPPASASDPVDAATKVMAVDQPTPPSFGVQVGNATLSESWKCSKL